MGFSGTTTLDATGVAQFDISTLPVGTNSLTGSYSGDSNYLASTSAAVSETIIQATPTISIGNIPASAIYNGSFTGTYIYSGNGSPTETVASSTTGVCKVSGNLVSYVGVGTCKLTAGATATTDYTAATGSPQSFTVGQATATISIGDIPISAIYNGSFTATYIYSGNGSPTETIASSTTGVCTVSGNAVSYVRVGTCTLTASATATTDYKAATGSPQSFKVVQATQAITFNNPGTQTAGTSLTLSATATSGLTVGFSSQTIAVCTVNGTTATFTIAGTCTIQATQKGNSDWAAATPVTRSFTVNPQPGIAPGGGGTASLTVTPGETSENTVTISVAGTNAFSGTVNLSCSVTTSMTSVIDAPTCSLNPASVTISGTTAQTSTLTVTTTPASSAENIRKKLFWPAGGTALALVVFVLVPRRRSWLAMLGLLLLFVFSGVAACGGGNSGTTAGTYKITVTGTSGTISATVGTVSLTVQ
jgi:hypothetical protein